MSIRKRIEQKLIKEFLIDLESIDCGVDDYMDWLADGDQLNKVIEKYKKRLEE